MTELANQNIVGVILAEWGVGTIIKYQKGKGDALRGQKITDQFLEIVERVIGKLIRKNADIDAMQFGFLPRCGTSNAIFILIQLLEKYLPKKKKN